MKVIYEDKVNVNESYTIEDIYASAWEGAIEEVAKILNDELETNFSLQDWAKLERVAERLNIKFDENGEIVR